jgi:hypothetical protein
MAAVSSGRRAVSARRALSGGAFVLISAALFSGLAFGLTYQRCHGAVFPNDATPSSYCSTLNLPHLPNSTEGIGLALLLFILPSVLVLIGALTAVRSERHLRLLWFGLPAAALIVLSFLLIPVANLRPPSF